MWTVHWWRIGLVGSMGLFDEMVFGGGGLSSGIGVVVVE
jgi:hypothetical protein